MFHNFISILLKPSPNIVLPLRHSALFVNGLKATETYVFITPHIDYPNIDKNQVQIDLNKRKSTFDLNKLQNLWNIYNELNQRKIEFERKRNEISQKLTKCIQENSNNIEINKLKVQINLLKDNIKTLKTPLWSAELAAMVEALKLPNKLHSLTSDKENILYTHLKCPKNSKNHLEIGTKMEIINFKKNENYYLCGDAAVFELGAKFYFSKKLKKYNYVQFSNTDFVKSVVIEGCGEDHTNPDCTFILHHNEDSDLNVDNRLHLTGAASLYSFFAFYAKNVIYSKLLPLKCFTLGRQYIPSPSDEDSLFHVSQSSAVQLFKVMRDENEQQSALNEIIKVVKEFYMDLGIHFRLNIIPAHKLLMWESLRVSVEMFSTSLGEYIEVGNISVSGDFLSKRFLFTYIENKQSQYPHIISGTILNVPKLLGCVLEQDIEFQVPEIFRVENWEFTL